jgi:ABC-type polysaccharide/polyol phosphate export permease
MAGMSVPRPLSAQSRDPSPLATSARDWIQGARLTSLWTNLALEDLRDRYRRTALGLGWIAVSFALFVLVKIFIFGQLAAVSAAEFGVFVTLGFGIWSFMNSMVLDGCMAYMQARPWILGTATPYPVFLLQAVYRNLLMFGFILAVMAVAMIWKPAPWRVQALAVIPALAIYIVTSVWLSAILAPLCARYRDLYHMMQTGMRLIFFATPILWMPESSGRLAMIAEANPLSHFVAIFRDPLMYNRVPMDSWIVVLAINAVGLVGGVVAYAATRRRLAHWV